ncbi:MAG: hypothetical protein KF886_15175 [Candidatus Hydrogenedentes bacterium]|nr:hypothetical protein [Candidatus Hydrogenedentota bacterium]
MGKALLYRLFSAGSIPDSRRSELEREGMVLADEGFSGHLVQRNLRIPGRCSLYKIRSFAGYLAITRQRILLCCYGKPQIDLPRDDPRVSRLQVSCPREGRLLISFRYEDMRPGWQGHAKFRINSPMASQFLDELTRMGAQVEA